MRSSTEIQSGFEQQAGINLLSKLLTGYSRPNATMGERNRWIPSVLSREVYPVRKLALVDVSII